LIWSVGLGLRWLWHSFNDRRELHGKGRLTLEPAYIIVGCVTGAIALLIVAGAVFFLIPNTGTAKAPTAVQSAANGTSANQGEFFAKNAIIATHANPAASNSQLVTYVADSASMGDRLRVFVDFSMHVPNAGWIGRNRVEIAQFKDYVRGQKFIVPVLSRYEENGDKNLMRWGANSYEAPDNAHKFGLADTYRARLVLMGPDGREQHHYFVIVRGASSSGELVPSVVADEHFTFRKQWEEEDAKS
jgi:hypothetical protein